MVWYDETNDTWYKITLCEFNKSKSNGQGCQIQRNLFVERSVDLTAYFVTFIIPIYRIIFTSRSNCVTYNTIVCACLWKIADRWNICCASGQRWMDRVASVAAIVKGTVAQKEFIGLISAWKRKSRIFYSHETNAIPKIKNSVWLNQDTFCSLIVGVI